MLIAYKEQLSLWFYGIILLQFLSLAILGYFIFSPQKLVAFLDGPDALPPEEVGVYLQGLTLKASHPLLVSWFSALCALSVLFILATIEPATLCTLCDKNHHSA